MRLLALRAWIGIKKAVEEARVARRFYPHKLFREADRALAKAYARENPHRISRQFLEARGEEDVHRYGETPLTTLETLAEEATIGPEDCVYELGCGRGRTCLWLHYVIGCQVVGIEENPAFVAKAKAFEEAGLEFVQGDYAAVDYREATVVYLYGTGLSDPEVLAVAEQLKGLGPKAKVITVSDPLPSDDFEVVKELTLPYLWGRASVYIQVKQPN